MEINQEKDKKDAGENPLKSRQGMIKGFVFAIIIIAVGVAVFNVLSTMNPTNRPVVSVSTAIAEERMITSDYLISGTLAPVSSANIVSKVPGIVNAVAAQKGDVVKAGDLLIELDDTDVQLQAGAGGMASDNVERLKLAYDLANDKFVKNEMLYKNGAISQMAYEDSKASMEQARLQYQSAGDALAQQIQKTSITAPISGIVVTQSVQKGDSVTQGTQLMSIVDMNQVILKGTVPESIIGIIKKDQEVEVKVDSLYGQSFQGAISFISPVSVPAGQIFPVEITIPNANGVLKAGMTGDASVKVEMTKPALAVPSSAVFERNGRKAVYVIEKDRIKITEVITGIESSDFTAIHSGISAGTEVVADATKPLMDGDQIKKI